MVINHLLAGVILQVDQSPSQDAGHYQDDEIHFLGSGIFKLNLYFAAGILGGGVDPINRFPSHILTRKKHCETQRRSKKELTIERSRIFALTSEMAMFFMVMMTILIKKKNHSG